MALNNDDTKRQDRIQKLLRTDDGKAFLEWITEHYNRATQQLKTVREPIDLGRHQGRVEAFELILKMKEE